MEKTTLVREASPPRYELIGEARDWCWQLLGPPPEKQDTFFRHPDGTPMARPAKNPPPPTALPTEPKPEKPKRARKKEK